MSGSHICRDCGRAFASGAALGGHRRVHTKGLLTKQKGYKSNRKRKRLSVAPPTFNNINTYNTNNNIFPFRTSPEPSSSEQKFYGQYITDISSDEDNDIDDDINNDNNDDYWNSNEFTAMPPPIKKRKLNDVINVINNNTASNIKKPTKMDAIREQIGLAMTLYHFNVDKLSAFCDIPKPIFIKWLKGEIDEMKEIKVNTKNNNNKQNGGNIGNAIKKTKKSVKKSVFKIKFKRPKKTENVNKVIKTENACYLTPILSEQITEKMQKWLDNFIRNGFIDEKYLEFVHHYKQYKRNGDRKGVFDWNDDSSFYYKINNDDGKEEGMNNNDDELIPIEIDDIINGKPIKDSFLWDPQNGISIKEFIECLCNDWRQSNNEELKERILKSMEEQIKSHKTLQNEYKMALNGFVNKIDNKSSNYLQHLKRKTISMNDNTNLMNNISDLCHGHILIKLVITHGKIRLIDEFLWNLNDSENNNNNNGSIEEFANILCSDQGIPFKFAPSIAYNIRKQINEYRVKMIKSMNENGNDLNTINDPLLHESLRYIGRNKEIDLRNLKMWQPIIKVYKTPNTTKTKVKDQ